jgi:hypothetical protein
MTMTAEPITSGQQKQFFRFVEDAAERAWADAGLDKRGLQRLIENGGEFQADIIASIKRLSVTNEFANEEVGSSYGPPPGWTPKDVVPQVARFREIWGVLHDVSEEALLQPYLKGEGASSYRTAPEQSLRLPDGIEGLLVFPTTSAMLRLVKGNKGWPDYNRVLKLILDTMKEHRRDFVDWTEGNIGPDFERPFEAYWKRLLAFEGQTKADFIVLPGQTGIRHRGRSPRRARVLIEDCPNEIGGNSIQGGCILLAHPERLTAYEHLVMDCPGSERAPRRDGDFTRVSCWNFGDGGLRFFSLWAKDPRGSCGSVSLRLPE